MIVHSFPYFETSAMTNEGKTLCAAQLQGTALFPYAMNQTVGHTRTGKYTGRHTVKYTDRHAGKYRGWNTSGHLTRRNIGWALKEKYYCLTSLRMWSCIAGIECKASLNLRGVADDSLLYPFHSLGSNATDWDCELISLVMVSCAGLRFCCDPNRITVVFFGRWRRWTARSFVTGRQTMPRYTSWSNYISLMHTFSQTSWAEHLISLICFILVWSDTLCLRNLIISRAFLAKSQLISLADTALLSSLVSIPV